MKKTAELKMKHTGIFANQPIIFNSSSSIKSKKTREACFPDFFKKLN